MVLFNSTCPIPAEAEQYGVRGTAWKPMVILAFACMMATVVISVSLIILHLRRYRAPKEQRQIIRIVFSVSVYSIVAFFEVFSYEVAQYIDPFGDLYEALGLCALFLLYVQYAAPQGTFNDDLFTAVKEAEEKESGFDWPRIGWIFVFQYPIIFTICVIIIEGTEAGNEYCVNSLSPAFGHLWVQLLQSFSIGACIIAIVTFYGRMKSLMRVRRALAKLGCFKLIVAIRFLQSWIFSLLLEYHVIKTSSSFSYNDILWGITGTATCAEMVLCSGLFWYAFSASEYSSTAKPHHRPLPLWRAVLDAMNPTDLILGMARIPGLFMEVQRKGDWAKWRAARKQQGIGGAIRKGVAKYQGGRDGGPGRYQELDESMEAMTVRPAQSHHSRMGSNAADEDVGYHMHGIGGQQLYQPPSGSPPDEAGQYLMADSHIGRPRSPSQGQWNGQGYDRAPSPSGRYSAEVTEGRQMV